MIKPLTTAPTATIDANEAVARVAYKMSEVIAIYPITPSSPMAELADEWSAGQKPNLWDTVPGVTEMQSEGGAAGALHGALSAGALATTFTASQGLLLMIPNMYKIAGELSPFVMHVTARALATHALSIFGDHSDVMACRQTGFALLASGSVQEAHDLAAIAHAATLPSRIPFLHFFDGFRTSHEINTLRLLEEAVLRDLIDTDALAEVRARAMTPDRPDIRGTAQNPDVFFQAREAANPFYLACPEIVQKTMDTFAVLTGRSYHLFDYTGDPEAEEVAVVMGSGSETLATTSEYLNAREGRKTGVVTVRLYRPFHGDAFLAALPRTVRRIAVLDRTKEPGSLGEPLYLDVVTAIEQAFGENPSILDTRPRVVGGRYGLGSKEFNPGMARAVFDNLRAPRPRHSFTVGINDDVTGLSLRVEQPDLDIEDASVFRALFYGLGADGTVGANKNTIKIIGDSTGQYAQAYFVYDSKKSGAMTISHLRFGPDPIQAPYLIKNARFIGCHVFGFLDKYDVLGAAAPGAVLLINTPFGPEELWANLSRDTIQAMIDKQLKVYLIDGNKVAKEAGMGGRTNTIMQTAFFAISGILPREQAIGEIKHAIEKTYGKKGQDVVEKNFQAVDQAVGGLREAPLPATAEVGFLKVDPLPAEAPDFVKKVIGLMLAGEGERLPVSALPVDGRWPSATTQWEKRNIALEIPIWDPSCCTQCNKCITVCPHATIRGKFFEPGELAGSPDGFQSVDYRDRNLKGKKFTIQVAPEDCTGCGLCVQVCPGKNRKEPRLKAINMMPLPDHHAREKANWEFFFKLPDPPLESLDEKVKSIAFRRPLFEFSGACAGCGETPYLRMLSQLFGDRLMIANATGCSSIYGGNLPTTPYCVDGAGRGPAWSNSLFEDNAEFGLGMRLGVDKQKEMARELLEKQSTRLDPVLVLELLNSSQLNDLEIRAQRDRVQRLRESLVQIGDAPALELHRLADYLVEKSIWIVGGDGWAYDIGFGGLDHVFASGRKVNILVLDTEVYSNTGGQQSKSTPIGAVAKFAAAGKSLGKKDLGMIAMGYGQVYVAQVSLGARDSQVAAAFQEANSWPGVSLIIAYSHCIAHGYNLTYGIEQQKLAVNSGYWPIYRFDPRNLEQGKPALTLDSAKPKVPLSDYMSQEGRFKMLALANPERAKVLARSAQAFVETRYAKYELLAGKGPVGNGGGAAPEAAPSPSE